MKKLFLFCILHYGLVLLAQDPALLSKKADQFYRDSQFVEAEEFYRKADHAKPEFKNKFNFCLLYTSPSPRDRTRSRMPSSA